MTSGRRLPALDQMPNEDAKRQTEQSRARLNVKERGMLQNFTKAVRELQLTFRDVFSPYRPELCYMRGPGPACRARSSGIPGAACQAKSSGSGDAVK